MRPSDVPPGEDLLIHIHPPLKHNVMMEKNDQYFVSMSLMGLISLV